MGTLHHEIHIAAPPERVWAVLADLEAVQRYNPMVASTRLTSPQREGVGATRSCELKPNGRVTERVMEWERGRVVGLEVVESTWPIAFMRWRTEVHPNGSGTLVRQALAYQLKFGVLGRILEGLIVHRKLRGGLDQVFAALKQHVEAQPQPREVAS